MCAANRSSLEISYVHLGEMHALLAIWLTDLPKEMLKIFDEVLYKEVLVLFPHYAQVTADFVSLLWLKLFLALVWFGLI
jgi:hypothetical protein